MTLWVLDTDHLSLFQLGHPRLRRRVNAVNPEEIAVTIITAEEQLRGRMNVIRRASSSNARVLAYRLFRDTLNDLKSINLLDFDQDAEHCYAELIRQKIRIGTQDLRIAAITISKNGILLTRNQRDFSRVPGLSWQDWTVE